jgi:hypothetical protein
MAVTGYGLAFGRVWRWRTGTAEPLVSLGDAGLAGLLVLAAFGIVLHFFISLSPGLALTLNSVGLILLVVLGRSIIPRYDITNWLFILLCALTFGLQAQLDALHPDAGIYYIPSILWNSAEPIIPGLANVQGRLGYNNAGLVLATVLRLPVIIWKGAFLLNALFAFFVMLAFFERLRMALATSGVTRISTIYCLLMVGGFCAKNFVFNGNLGSLGTDFGPFLLACYVGFLLLLSAEDHDPSLAGWSTLLATLAVLLKLSALPLLCGSLLVLFLSRGALSNWQRMTLATLFLTLGLLGSWAIRGLFLSGCAAYPALATCVSQLPWMVPAELAKNESQYILDYSRGTIEDPRSIPDWLSPLCRELLENHIGRFLLLLSGSGLILIAAGTFLFRNKRALGSNLRTGLAPICIGLGWVLFAILRGPALRFYSGGAFLFAYTLAAYGMFQFRDILASLQVKRWVPRVLCLLLTIQGAVLAIKYLRTPSQDWPFFETPEVLQRSTDSGLLIWVSVNEYCWDAPLPCTPYFDPALRRIAWVNRFYFVGHNTIAYSNGFPPRVRTSEAK